MQKHFVNLPYVLLCAAGLLLAQCALAVDHTFSGFGTIGYAQSNQPYNYQRFINDTGTVTRDTLLGAQLDTRFNPEWSVTVQGKLAPALDLDNSWHPVISWAFLSYRPSNDLLIRAGKLRMPFYLHSENMDVGATYDAARLPNELYAVSPTLDFTGASFVKTWPVGDSEIALDGYWGKSKVPWRTYSRDTSTPNWLNLEIAAKGLLLSWHQDDNIFRAGYHDADITQPNGDSFNISLLPNTLPPASGMSGTYYTLPPPSGRSQKITTPTISLGLDAEVGQGFRTIAEYVRRKVKGTYIGPDTEAYYFSLLKEVDRWTPYITYSRIVSKNLAAYQSVNDARVKALVPFTAIPAASINAAQRGAADSMTMYDQYAWSIGSSYAIDKKSKIKAELSSIHTGAVSSFVDAPAGGESGNKRINVFSFSYNFMF